MTYKQAAELGGQVRKGEHGRLLSMPTNSPRKVHRRIKGAAVEIRNPVYEGLHGF